MQKRLQPQTSGQTGLPDNSNSGKPVPFWKRLGILDVFSMTANHKCLVALFIYGVFHLLYVLYYLLVYLRPQNYPEINIDFVGFILPTISIEAVFFLILARWAWKCRNDPIQNQALIHLSLALMCYDLVYVGYVFGFFTQLLVGLSLLSSWVLGLVLFPKKIFLSYFLPTLFINGLFIYACHKSWLPYAIFFNQTQDIGTGPVTSLVNIMTLHNLIVFLLALGITYYLVDEWHKQEQLQRKNTQHLWLANDFVGRHFAHLLIDKLNLQLNQSDKFPYSNGEERAVAMIFCDIFGFQELSEHLPTAQLNKLLSDYTQRVENIARHYAIKINESVTDTLILILDTQQQQSTLYDISLFAARIAFEIQEQLQDVRVPPDGSIPHNIHFRVALHACPIYASRGQDHAILKTPQLSRQISLVAQLLAQCEPDCVYLSQDFWLQVKDDIPCMKIGSLKLYSINEPYAIYALRAKVADFV